MSDAWGLLNQFSSERLSEREESAFHRLPDDLKPEELGRIGSQAILVAILQVTQDRTKAMWILSSIVSDLCRLLGKLGAGGIQ